MEPTSGSAILLGLSGILGGFSDILVIIEFFTSTMQPEIHEIYKYTYDTRQNLINLMDHLGAIYDEKLPPEIKSRLDSILEGLKEGYGSYGEVRSHSIETEVEANQKLLEMLQDFFKKQVETIEQLHEEYPFTYPLEPGAKIEDGKESEETDLAATDTGQMVALLQQLHDKIDMVSFSPGASDNLQEGRVMGVDGPSILNKLTEINEKLNTFAMQDIEVQAETIAGKVVEKTGTAVSPEEKVTVEQMAEIISAETENLPEQHEEMLKMLEQNQTIMYSYKDQLLRMEHMIQTKAMSIDQIYRKIVKKMWDEYRCGG